MMLTGLQSCHQRPKSHDLGAKDAPELVVADGGVDRDLEDAPREVESGLDRVAVLSLGGAPDILRRKISICESSTIDDEKCARELRARPVSKAKSSKAANATHDRGLL